MGVELTLSLETLYGFLLVLTRVGGAFTFVPLPGFRDTPVAARMVVVLSLTCALMPLWPSVAVAEATPGRLALWVVAEAGLGMTVGLAVAFLNEAFVVGSQLLGLQAGYAYASTIDPTTQADSSVLQIFSQLAASLLFFALGMDAQVIRAFALSLETIPPGTFVIGTGAAGELIRLGSGMFLTGLRLALPVVAILVLMDLALALLGRIHEKLQLLSLAFAVKMSVAMVVIASLAAMLPGQYEAQAEKTVRVLRGVLNASR